MLFTALAAFACVLLLADPAAARAMRLVDMGTIGSWPNVDGPYLTWHYNGDAIVYDARTGRRTVVAAPDGCPFVDGDRNGDLLFQCGTFLTGNPRLPRGWIRDSATARLKPLPAFGPPRAGTNDVRVYALNVSWISLYEIADDPFEYFARRSTGEIGLDLPNGHRHVLDLDTPKGWRPLCSSLTPRSSAGHLEDPDDFGQLAVAGRRAATMYRPRMGARRRVVLQQCGTPERILYVPAADERVSMPIIDSRLVAWTSTRRETTRLHVMSLNSKRRRSIALPANATPVLAAQRLHLLSRGRLLRVEL